MNRNIDVNKTPPFFSFNLTVMLLAIFAVITLTWGVTNVIGGLEFPRIWLIILFSFFLGNIIPNVQVKKRWVSVMIYCLAFAIGVILVFFVVGRLGDEVYELGRQIIIYAQARFDEFTEVDAQQIFVVWNDLWLKWANLFSRLFNWLGSLPNPGVDFIALRLVWALVLWVVAFWFGWSKFRFQQIVPGIIPAFLLLGMVRVDSNQSIAPFVVLLLITLLSMALMAYQNQEQGWRNQNIRFTSSLWEKTARASYWLTFSLVLFAVVASGIDWDELRDRWRERRARIEAANSNIGEATQVVTPSIIPTRTPSPLDAFERFSKGGFPTLKLINSPPELLEEVVMQIRLEDVSPSTGEQRPAPSDQNYYIKALTFDRYRLNGWTTTEGNVISYEANSEALESYDSNQRLVYQNIIFEEPYNGLVHVAGDLALIDAPIQIAYRARNEERQWVDVFGVLVQDAQQYNAYSVVPDFGEEELKLAGQNYPDWVLEHYLEIPLGVSERVLDLTSNLTLAEETPYDRAVAIEQYLRTNFPYTLDVPLRPQGKELVDYFLFDLREGYCDYYATAMVVMARAVGLPARLAVGYLAGSSNYVEEVGAFVITNAEAHSWVEIYFPEYGWVVFEPTAGRPNIDRNFQRDDIDMFDEVIIEPEIDEPFTLNYGLADWLRITLILFVISTPIIWVIGDRWWLSRLGLRELFDRLYRRIDAITSTLSEDLDNVYTPLELLANFNREWGQTPLANIEGDIWQRVPSRVEWLIRQVSKLAYGKINIQVEDRKMAIAIWAKLRWPILLAYVWKRWQKVTKRYH